jgi:hypothetical protein
MDTVKSKFAEFEVWETSDGEVFLDEDKAKQYQEYLNLMKKIEAFGEKYKISGDALVDLYNTMYRANELHKIYK